MRKILKLLEDLFGEDENKKADSTAVIDEFYFAATVIIDIVILAVLFWLLWSILVYGGGIFPKIKALFEIIFYKKSFKDFGWNFYPYDIGVFTGFVTNIIGIVLLCFFIISLSKIMHKLIKKLSKEEEKGLKNGLR